MASVHEVPTVEPAETPIEDRPFARRHPFVPWIVASIVVAVLHGILRLDLVISLALGAMVGFLGGLLDGMWLARQEALIETQLSAAIDLMVGAVRGSERPQRRRNCAARNQASIGNPIGGSLGPVALWR